MEKNYLVHFGINGMKWGIRRYQNSDGTLTEEGKQRYRKEYSDRMTRAKNRSYDLTDRYVRAYNSTVDKMNSGLTEKYNREYDEKLGESAKGHDYLNDEEYNRGYEELFNNLLNENWRRETYADITSSRDYRKAQELVNKYGEELFSDLIERYANDMNLNN